MTDDQPRLQQPGGGEVGEVDRLAGRVRAAHDAAEGRGEAGYPDPGTGLFVFTRARLLGNGRCCRLGCRHCPYR